MWPQNSKVCCDFSKTAWDGNPKSYSLSSIQDQTWTLAVKTLDSGSFKSLKVSVVYQCMAHTLSNSQCPVEMVFFCVFCGGFMTYT